MSSNRPRSKGKRRPTYFRGTNPSEMGRSLANAEVRPKNSAECSARFGSATCDHSAEVRPNFGKHSASYVASHLRRFTLAADVN